MPVTEPANNVSAVPLHIVVVEGVMLATVGNAFTTAVVVAVTVHELASVTVKV